jgi:hypothetical protein
VERAVDLHPLPMQHRSGRLRVLGFVGLSEEFSVALHLTDLFAALIDIRRKGQL